MSTAGRITWVRFVLSAMPIYVLIAVKAPKWFIKAVDKLRCAYLWSGHKQVNGGSCLVSWEKVQQPLEYGGLGILKLEYMSWALHIRWLWLAKTDKERPWSGLEVPVHQNAKALFAIALQSHVGNGNDTYFWTDRWLLGVALRILHQMFVHGYLRGFATVQFAAALHDQQWPSDLQGGLSMIGL
jgi:hypothetical protein